MEGVEERAVLEYAQFVRAYRELLSSGRRRVDMEQIWRTTDPPSSRPRSGWSPYYFMGTYSYVDTGSTSEEEREAEKGSLFKYD